MGPTDSDLQQDLATIDLAEIPPATDDAAGAEQADGAEATAGVDAAAAADAPPAWAQQILNSTTNLTTQLRQLETRIERAEGRGVAVDPDLKAQVEKLTAWADEQRLAGMTHEEREAELRKQLTETRTAATSEAAVDPEQLQAAVEEFLEEAFTDDLMPDFQRYARAAGMELTTEHAAAIRNIFNQFEFKADRTTGRVTNMPAFRQHIQESIDATVVQVKQETERSPARQRSGANGPAARPGGAAPARGKADFVNASLRDLLSEAPELREFQVG